MRVHTSNERIFVVVVSDIVPSRIYVIHRLGSPYCEKLYSIEGKGFPNTDRPGWRITFLLFSRKKTSRRSCNKPPWFAGNIAGNNLVRYRNQSNCIFLLALRDTNNTILNTTNTNYDNNSTCCTYNVCLLYYSTNNYTITLSNCMIYRINFPPPPPCLRTQKTKAKNKYWIMSLRT